MNTLVNKLTRDTESNMEEITEYLTGIQETLSTGLDSFMEAMEKDKTFDELVTDPANFKTELYNQVDEQVRVGKISSSGAQGLKKSIDGACSFGLTSFSSWEEMEHGIQTQMLVEEDNYRKQMGKQKTRMEKIKEYGAETKRQIKGMPPGEKLSAAIGGVTSVISAVDKFKTGDALNVVSGVLDITNAIAAILPPPASIVTETLSGILGMFMPGAAGPDNQAVIDEIKEEFEQQNEFIAQKFAEQKIFIQKQFDEAVEEIQDFISLEHLKEIQTQSVAVLDYLQEKQAYLDRIDPNYLNEDELTRVTNDLQIMDNTKDTSIIRQVFLSDCVGEEGAISHHSRLQHSSKEVKICLLIMYNYFTIEKYRYELLVKFLALRNMVPDHTGVTAGYWDVVKTRNQVVRDFIQTIESNKEGAQESWSSHAEWTGLKIRCYIAGDGDYLPSDNSLSLEHRTDIQEFVKSVMGSISYDGYSEGSDAICHQSYTDEPCKQYVDRCKSK